MDDRYFTVRISKKWVRVTMIVGVTALIVAPLTAIASHSFTDVPDSNTFHEDIAWLADADVTRGCNPPDNTEFCPDDEVTRGQMAAFMRRLAENRVVDADTVDGLHATPPAIAFGGAAYDGPLVTSNTMFVDVDEVTITTDVPARLVVNVSAETRCEKASPTGSDWCAAQVLLNGEEMDPVAHQARGFAIDHAAEIEEFRAHAFTKVSPDIVEPGTHTLTFQVAVNDSDIQMRVDDWVIQVEAHSETQ